MIQQTVISMALLASPAAAVSAGDCLRRVDTYAFERDQTDLGLGRVSWTWSWTAEGVADDLFLADCASGEAIAARKRDENMTSPVPYDRRPRARRVLETLKQGPQFLTMARATEAFEDQRIPVRALTLSHEPCACAAFYPEARGDKTPFAAQ